MVPYFLAVGLAGMIIWGMLRLIYRHGSADQKRTIHQMMLVSFVLAALLPVLMEVVDFSLSVALLGLMAAMTGLVIPAASLFPAEALPDTNKSPDRVDLMPPQVPSEKTEKMTVLQAEELSLEETADTDEEPCLPMDWKWADDPELTGDHVDADDLLSEEEEDRKMGTVEKTSPVVSADEGSQRMGDALPFEFSETMTEVVLMNAMLALKEDEMIEAVESFALVCERGKDPDRRSMAYLELKRILPETGGLKELIRIGDKMLIDGIQETPVYGQIIAKDIHYFKRLVSLLNARNLPIQQPYSTIPEEVKKMALAHEEKNQNRSGEL